MNGDGVMSDDYTPVPKSLHRRKRIFVHILLDTNLIGRQLGASFRS